MSDFDFEELDQAINDLYESLDDNSEPTKSKESPANPKPVKTLASVATQVAKPTVDGFSVTDQSMAPAKSKEPVRRKPLKLMDIAPSKRPGSVKSAVATSQTNDPVKVSSPTVKAGKGRFMDVVNLAGDASVARKPNLAAKRQGKLRVVDLASPSQPAPAKRKPSKITITPNSSSPTDAKPAKSKGIKVATSSGDHDALAVAKTKSDSAKSISQSVTTQVAGRRSKQYDNTSRRNKRKLAQPLPVTDLRPLPTAETADRAQVKPFLTDTKVHKRPLGVRPRTTVGVSGRPRASIDRGIADDLRESMHLTSEQQVDGSNSGKSPAIKVVGWILLFIAVVALGSLAGFAFYYLVP